MSEKDISTICEMQHRIDAYQTYITMLSTMVREEDPEARCLLYGTPLDGLMGELWKEVRRMVQYKVLREL